VNIQLNIVTRPTYPDKFIRDNVAVPFVLLSIVNVTLPLQMSSFLHEQRPKRRNVSQVCLGIINICSNGRNCHDKRSLKK